MLETVLLICSIGVAAVAFLFAAWLYRWVKRQPATNARIAEVSGYIREGAATFLNKEYAVLARFAGVVMLLILLFLPSPIWIGGAAKNITMAVAYAAGTVFSAFAGKIGIQVATIANAKTAEAAQKGIRLSFLSGFRGGAVMGMAVVGASLLGVSLVLWVTGDTTALLGFSFGASSMALFA
jgi:K(+)-stimulated pyrophosphate-energized sodium pump